jgi:hypothetical protein
MSNRREVRVELFALGNIREFDGRVGEVAKAAGAAGVPIRIGLHAGSVDKRFMTQYGKATHEALVEFALWEASLFAEHGSTSRSASSSPMRRRWSPPTSRRDQSRLPGHHQVRVRLRRTAVAGRDQLREMIASRSVAFIDLYQWRSDQNPCSARATSVNRSSS